MPKGNIIIRYHLMSAVICAISNASFAQTKDEILDNRIKAFNERNIEKYLEPLHDSVRQVVFPNNVTDSNKQSVRTSYTSAFNALDGQITVKGRKDFGEFCIEEQSLERLGHSPVVNYVMYKFKGNRIIEILYLPKNYDRF